MTYKSAKGFGTSNPDKYEDVKFLTLSQVRIMLKCIEESGQKNWQRDHALIFLGLMLGLRCGEAVILCRRNFRDIGKGVVHIPTLKTRTLNSVPEKEPPFVEKEVIAYAKKYLSTVMRKDQDWLFESSHGSHVSTHWARKIFAHWILCAKLDPLYSFHSLRHGRGVMVWDVTGDLVAVSKCLRHKDVKAAQIYAHLSPKKRDEYRKAMESNYGESE